MVKPFFFKIFIWLPNTIFVLQNNPKVFIPVIKPKNFHNTFIKPKP